MKFLELFDGIEVEDIHVLELIYFYFGKDE